MAYLPEMTFTLGASSWGLNRGRDLFKSTRLEVYHMMMENERMSNILKKKLLGKTKALMYFESSLERDIMNKGKVARTVVHIKCWRK